ncbi:MAG: hypothetical protein ACYS1A_19085 [Planctomycetota bacterium]|jgi:hypothetical protein
MSEHTKGKLRFEGRYIYSSTRKFQICEVPSSGILQTSLDNANAERLVLCWNNYDKTAQQRDELLAACEKINQCIRCKYGFRQQELSCPTVADGDLPCIGYKEEYSGISFIESAIAGVEK